MLKKADFKGSPVYSRALIWIMILDFISHSIVVLALIIFMPVWHIYLINPVHALVHYQEFHDKYTLQILSCKGLLYNIQPHIIMCIQ